MNPTKRFYIPSWIPACKTPTYQYDITPPTYQEITKIIRHMKASGSPSPLDQISIIVFKRCPYLRSYLQDVFKKVSCTGQIPSMWKKALTILIYKKGEQNDAQNFRPITLQTVPLKIYTSFLRNRMYNFLNKNGSIESTIQKGFTPGMAGTFEYTYHMAHSINQARAKQRSIVITLLDLKNAFGEVHHNLITDVLSHHHIPPEIRELLNTCILTFLHVYQHQSTLQSLFNSRDVFYRAIALVHYYSIYSCRSS